MDEDGLQSAGQSVTKGVPLGDEARQARVAKRPGLHITLRPRGRPRKDAHNSILTPFYSLFILSSSLRGDLLVILMPSTTHQLPSQATVNTRLFYGAILSTFPILPPPRLGTAYLQELITQQPGK